MQIFFEFFFAPPRRDASVAGGVELEIVGVAWTTVALVVSGSVLTGEERELGITDAA